MTIKRKDFQKAAAFLQEFLLKLSDDMECAELRDSLNLVLLYMQKYYKSLQNRSYEKSVQHSLNMSRHGLSPLTPFVDAPDKFQWKWLNLDSQRLTSSMSVNDSSTFTLPSIIQAAKQGDIKQMLNHIRREPSCVDERDGIGRTALSYSVHFHQIDSLKILLQNSADVNATAHDGSTALHQACHDSSYIALHILLEFGADLNIQDNLGRYPIHWAATTPSNDCLRLLIQYKANVKLCDKEGMTPSMWACRLDHIKHLEILTQADPSESNTIDDVERDYSGRTWMHWSLRRTEPLECLRTLLTEDTAKIKDAEGKTVLLLAAEQGSLVSCRVIVDIAGEECIRDVDDQHRTALHLATMGGHGDCVNFFLERQADLNVVDKYNATAWDYARNRQLHYCQLILMSHQRQRLGSNRSTPYGFDASILNGDITADDDNDLLSFYNNLDRSTHRPIKPITPPNPPKRPRRSINGQHLLTRRAHSLPHTPKPDQSNDRLVLSANNIHRSLAHAADRSYTDDSIPLGMSTPYSTHQYVCDNEVDENGRGMEVSYEGDNTPDVHTPHPPTAPPPTAGLQPTPPTTPLQAPQQLTGISTRSLPLPKSPTIPLALHQPTIPVTPPAHPKPQPRQLWQPSPPVTPPHPTSPVHGVTTNTAPWQPPLSPLHRPSVHKHIAPTTPVTSPTPKTDASRPGSASSQEQVSNTLSSVDTVRTVVPHRPQPAISGISEGKKIPPPVLTPLKNAPQPPIIDESLPHRTKRKKKKKRNAAVTSPTQLTNLMSPASQTVPDFGPTVMRAPSAAPRGMTQGSSSLPQSQHPVPHTSHKREQKCSESSLDAEMSPPMVSGHAYPLASHRERASARPRYHLNVPPPDESSSPPSASEKLDEATNDNDASESNIVTEDGDGVGPLIPPPQAFRGTSGRPQQLTRPLSVSVPLDGQSFQSLSAAGKPPIPRGHTMSASSLRNHYRRPRARPNTGSSTNL